MSHRLIKAIDELMDFLAKANQKHWVNILSEIKNDLNHPDKRDNALKTLGQYFGGMGSLNDIWFSQKHAPQGYSPEQANLKLDKLLDNLFKEYKLFGVPLIGRILWKILEFKHKKDVPPRIKNAFK